MTRPGVWEPYPGEAVTVPDVGTGPSFAVVSVDHAAGEVTVEVFRRPFPTAHMLPVGASIAGCWDLFWWTRHLTIIGHEPPWRPVWRFDPRQWWGGSPRTVRRWRP